MTNRRCNVCRKRVRLDANGLIVEHDAFGRKGTRCPGSNKPPWKPHHKEKKS